MAETTTEFCRTKGCNKPAGRLTCPKCTELGLNVSFCSKECFTGYYKIHKEKDHAVNPKFQNYKFTGPLRPGVVSPMNFVPPHIKRPDYAETGIPESEKRSKKSQIIEVKNAKQIEAMRVVCKLGREILDIAGKAAKVGVTTDEIDQIVHKATIERNAYPSTLNYVNFPKSVCTSVNEVVCHGIPDSRKLEDGDILNIDVSVYYGGVHADLNETFLIGNVDEKGKKLVQTCREALAKSIEIVKPGALYRDIGNVIEKYVKAAGFSVVQTFCGHGIGELFHSLPNVPHYARSKAVGTMKAGHVFTIEPMINEGTYRDEIWPDDWTDVTIDGKRSAQFEHTLLVTETGCEILTA
eukprot:TRINITY_DN2883_c0_g2_i1.p1 TRINITY_DN2883_c0_g2~~TRINITY_DN2883_c0_g2_i1.p1  ORF type:complete len:389 (+),score=48.34 TRINITY_DN2883_c0_g2_i1:114-1169(+)